MRDHQFIIETRATTTTKTKVYQLCGLSGNLLETRVLSSLWVDALNWEIATHSQAVLFSAINNYRKHRGRLTCRLMVL